MTEWYCGSTLYTAVTAWSAKDSEPYYQVGDIVRPTAATAGNERVYRCTTGNVASGALEPSWVTTAGLTTNDGSIVWTEITGQSAYGWTAPHARIANALVTGWASTAGDTIYVSHSHAESSTAANITITSLGTAAAPINLICVDDAATPPDTLATSATVTTGTTYNITIDGFLYVYGITFSSGSGSSTSHINFANTAAKSAIQKYENCKMILAGNSASSDIIIGTSSTNAPDRSIHFINTTLKFANASQTVKPYTCSFKWQNTLTAIDAAGTTPTILFTSTTNGTPAEFILEGVDLSQLGSGKSLFLGSATAALIAYLKNCKLGASVSIISAAIVSQGALRVYLENCSDTDPSSGLRAEEYSYQGSIKSDLLTYRAATDGLASFSYKYVSLAGASFFSPLVSKPIYVWNSIVGSEINVTVEILHDSATNLKDDDIWLEIQYLGTSGYPLASVSSGRRAIFGTGADLAEGAGTETWTISPSMDNAKSQKLTKALTASEPGYLFVRVVMAKPSYPVFVCPKVSIA